MNVLTNIPCPYCQNQTVTPYEAPIGSGRYWAKCCAAKCGHKSRASVTLRGKVIEINHLSKMGRTPGKWGDGKTAAASVRYNPADMPNGMTAQKIVDNWLLHFGNKRV